ncbi:hypothetical protein [Arsenophonus nasoniae]|uniref:Uncharacterized protein n=1 Tax=Arsenophonus nasoniae TaxID=638 RepID=A0AA95K8E7_9GAMM|nr:hypothetical protein [Arsenophonus nasoniae]WGL95852.1 hypothetical protein QE207_04465 [Arsenophonus nasoniae]
MVLLLFKLIAGSLFPFILAPEFIIIVLLLLLKPSPMVPFTTSGPSQVVVSPEVPQAPLASKLTTTDARINAELTNKSSIFTFIMFDILN